MVRKIYDIKPPKSSHKKVPVAKHLLSEDKAKKKSAKKVKSSKSLKRNLWVIGSVVVLLIAAFVFFKLPRVTITIWPKLETLSFEQTITADKSVDLVDQEKAHIPAQYFEAAKTETQIFPATGNYDNTGKATGTITVYNKADPVTSLTLKTGTHFLSDSGKLFTISQRIIIPAAKKVGSKITPGSIQVQVQAAEGGESYNIGPSNFSVPGLKGSAYYYSIYAVSTDSMKGGVTGRIKKVTEDDIQEAKNSLTKQVSDNAILELRKQIPAEYVLLENAIFSNITDASTKTKTGTVADDFTYQATAKASALVFKKSDIEQFAKEHIVLQIPDGKTYLENSLAVDYLTKTVDVSSGKATISLNFSAQIYQGVDKNSLSLLCMNKSADQINQIIDSKMGEQLEKVKINFWPFWVNKSPNNQKAVKVELTFD